MGGLGCAVGKQERLFDSTFDTKPATADDTTRYSYSPSQVGFSTNTPSYQDSFPTSTDILTTTETYFKESSVFVPVARGIPIINWTSSQMG